MAKTTKVLFLISVALSARAADETSARLERAESVFAKLTATSHGIPPKKIDSADGIAVVPDLKKGAAALGTGFGRGSISCRTDAGRSTPGAIAVETGSLRVQLGAEEIDIVILSMDRSCRPKLLSDGFTIGADAAAVWGNGKATHADPIARIVFFGSTKGAFAGFGFDGATIKWDESGAKALYGTPLTNTVIVNGGKPTPKIAEAF